MSCRVTWPVFSAVFFYFFYFFAVLLTQVSICLFLLFFYFWLVTKYYPFLRTALSCDLKTD